MKRLLAFSALATAMALPAAGSEAQQPADSAAAALRDLEERIDTLVLSARLSVPAGNPSVRSYVPPVTLSVPRFHREGMPDGVGHPPGIGAGARISADQARKILDALRKAGFFQRARRFLSDGRDEPPWPEGRHCHIRITAWKGTERCTVVAVWLPWNAGILTDLDAIRSALDGKAAEAMDKLLSALAEQRKQWAKERPPPAPHADSD